MAARCAHAVFIPHGVGARGLGLRARSVVARERMVARDRVSNTIFYGGSSYTEVEVRHVLPQGASQRSRRCFD